LAQQAADAVQLDDDEA
jgi:hypothetical protein